MSEPARWRDTDGVDPDVASLLEHATPSADMPGDVDALLRARMASLAKTPPTPSAWPRLAGIAGGTGIAVVVAVVVWSRIHAAPAPAPIPTPSVIAPSAATSIVLPDPVASAPLVDPVISADSSARGPRPVPTATAEKDTLSAEAQYLERARSKLDARPAEALRELDAHAARFPKGQLAAEREYLAIVALHKLGRDADARLRADRFLVRYPSSPYVTLVKKLLPEAR